MMYESIGPDANLSQGDILDDCPIVFLEEATTPGNAPEASSARQRVIVLTQACDMAQSKASRILVAVVQNAQQLVNRGILKSQLIRDQIRLHRVYGWYFLPAGSEMPESLIDLRDLHTIPRSWLERLVGEGKRLGRIATPYREHLAQHFSTTYSRIGLPDPFQTLPDE
jgi:hypothetical protein